MTGPTAIAGSDDAAMIFHLAGIGPLPVTMVPAPRQRAATDVDVLRVECAAFAAATLPPCLNIDAGKCGERDAALNCGQSSSAAPVPETFTSHTVELAETTASWALPEMLRTLAIQGCRACPQRSNCRWLPRCRWPPRSPSCGSSVTGSLMYKLGLLPPPPVAGFGSITTLRPASAFMPINPWPHFRRAPDSGSPDTMKARG